MGTQTKCNSCGAAGTGLVCAYCGNALVEPDSPQAELAAVRELQQHVSKAHGAERERLIRNAFLPDDEAALIEAGLTCVPWLEDEDVDEHYLDIEEAAAGRLNSIVSKLKIHSGSDAAKRAVSEFEAHLARHHKRQRAALWIGISVFAVLLCSAAALLWWMFA